ncbi:hypothetical protein BGP75_21545 [Motiliproteus sp. MSK22-1]|nr:hypothetical protein BGP75_21545 [Motiliproteus sp. MSK22-1]
MTLFDYDPSRSGSVSERLLAGYKGYLQTDGYEGYAAIGRQDGVINQGCWAHARRKFDEAIKAQGKPQKPGRPKWGYLISRSCTGSKSRSLISHQTSNWRSASSKARRY